MRKLLLNIIPENYVLGFETLISRVQWDTKCATATAQTRL